MLYNVITNKPYGNMGRGPLFDLGRKTVLYLSPLQIELEG